MSLVATPTAVLVPALAQLTCALPGGATAGRNGAGTGPRRAKGSH